LLFAAGGGLGLKMDFLQYVPLPSGGLAHKAQRQQPGMAGMSAAAAPSGAKPAIGIDLKM
jgi:hypothetical protein